MAKRGLGPDTKLIITPEEKDSPGYNGKSISPSFATLFEMNMQAIVDRNRNLWDTIKPNVNPLKGKIQVVSTVGEFSERDNYLKELFTEGEVSHHAFFNPDCPTNDMSVAIGYAMLSKKLLDLNKEQENLHNEMLYKQERLRKLNPLNF